MNQESKHVVLDEWITPAEAAEIIGVTPYQVRHLARTGTVEARKFGRAWMIKRDSVRAYAAQERHPGPKPQEPPTPD
ncbi:MAG: helix-turn-helix domain-containing protein [Thermoflexales bacterium]|nr:helix-turn-helix domain-containing protein [Thermoflexales bacterium]